RLLDPLLLGFFRLFNRGFNKATTAYTRAVGGLLRVSVIVLVVYAGLIGLTYWSFTHTPTGFIPSQDKGYLLVNVQLPDAASVERTEEVMRSVEDFGRCEWERVEPGAAFPWGRPATPDDAWRLRREFAAAAGLVIDDTKREFYRKVQREGQDDLLVPVSLNTP